MVDVPSSKDKIEQPENWFKRLMLWTRDRLESPDAKCDRILTELGKKTRIGGDNPYISYNDPDALVETAEKLLKVNGADIRSIRICLGMALDADPNHEEAKKLSEELGISEQ